MQTWNFPTPICSGIGALTCLRDQLASLGVERPVWVTDAGLPHTPLWEVILPLIEQTGGRCFQEVSPNPTGKNVNAGVEFFHSVEGDGVVALGGGSALDAAKAIAFMSAQSAPLWDFEDIGDAYTRAKADFPPVLAIPTTAGTGSEVGRAAVILNTDTQRKAIIFHPNMMPRVVLLDPELTQFMPPTLTANTGMDALSHHLEAYFAPGVHPMSDGIALEGIAMLLDALPDAYDEGSNLAARNVVQQAAMMGAVAFQKGLGAMHALAHSLGGLYDWPHGLLNAILMPYVIAFNATAIETKCKIICRRVGLVTHSTEAWIETIVALREKLGIPHALSHFQPKQWQMDTIVKNALRDPSARGNPCTMTIDNTRVLLEAAIEGALDRAWKAAERASVTTL